jgi:serine/threonine protein kinase
VITYFDHFVHNIDYVCIVTEYSEVEIKLKISNFLNKIYNQSILVKFGSLKDQLNECKINRVRFDPKEIYELIRQLISGIKFMHDSLGIIHRFIKPRFKTTTKYKKKEKYIYGQ